MTKSTRYVAIIAILLSTLSVLASAQGQGRANTSTTPANLRIRVNVVEVVMTDQNSKLTSGAAISYSIPTAQPRTSVTKEIRSVRSRDGKSLMLVEMTTVVVE
jgi:hypothetical protein